MEITKTSAILDFCLTNKDLETIPYSIKKNPHNKQRPIKLYDLDTIINLATTKHKSLDYLDLLKNNRKIRSNKIIQTKVNKSGCDLNNIMIIVNSLQ